jgi:queuine tRNA-ribosyltransferase
VTDPSGWWRRLADDPQTAARVGCLTTPHGQVDTPAFMPVGTQGTVKGVTCEQLRHTGSQMILGNTYHLALRPGGEVIEQLGGLQQFSGWRGPMLTDSGGFQVFSLGDSAVVDEVAVRFRSHIDGSTVVLSPERSMEIQQQLGSDIAMVLDHVVPLPADDSLVELACDRSLRWAERCRRAHRRSDQALFGIVQGGLDARLRQRSAEGLCAIGFDGYAIGGLSVGEPPPQMYATLEVTCPLLPAEQPRYLMGVGRPIDLLEGIARGVDMFDCVMPTRNGRNALAFTAQGTLRLRNSQHRLDPRPLEEDCPCPACKHHSRAYLRHLFMAKEMLGPVLLSIHNLTFYQRLMAQARQAIVDQRYGDFLDQQRRTLAMSGPADA